jgi:hypothetical protein
VEFITFFNFVLKYSLTYFVSQSVTGHLTVHVQSKAFCPVFNIIKRGIFGQTSVKSAGLGEH